MEGEGVGDKMGGLEFVESRKKGGIELFKLSRGSRNAIE